MLIKNKKYLITFIIFALIAVFAISAFAIGNPFAKEPEFSEGKAISEISIYESEARAGAKLKQSITFADKKFNGKYVETSVTGDGRYYDKYTCDNGKFKIDNNDNLCSVKIYLDKDSEKELLDIFKGNSESITKEQATEYAKKYINDNLAEYSDYDIIDVVEADVGHKYDYFFVEIGKRYGDFIGERGSIRVLRNGDVLEWSIYYLDKFDDFDKTKAQKLSFKTVESFTETELKNKYGDTLKDFEIKSVNLDKKDDIYFLNVIVSVEHDDIKESITIEYSF